MDDIQIKRRLTGQPEATPERERRRIGIVEHDERGNASVRWRDAPLDAAVDRPPLEVLDNPGLTLKQEDTFDPYASRPLRGAAPSGHAGRAKPRRPTDLRKLSEWIKMTRELEKRKRRGDPDAD